MPKFSSFTRYGHLAFSGAPTEGEKFYRAMSESTKDAYAGNPGGHVDATRYARAMAFASTRWVLRHAENQHVPGKRAEMLPALERTYDLTPAPTQTLKERNADVTARELLSRGASLSALEDAVRAVIGDALLRIAVPVGAQVEMGPDDIAPEYLTPCIFSDPRHPPKFFKILSPILPVLIDFGSFTVWEHRTFTYTGVQGEDDGTRLVKNEQYVVGYENGYLAEKVTIADTGEADGVLRATAVFTKPHSPNILIRSGPAPLWRSTRRTLMVYVKAGTVTTTMRRAVHRVLEASARAVTRWTIVDVPSPYDEVPAFVVGQTIIGTTPIGDTPFAI